MTLEHKIDLLLLCFGMGSYVVGWVVGRWALKRKANRALVDYADQKMTAAIDSAGKSTKIDGLFDVDSIIAEKESLVRLIKSLNP